MPAWDRPATPKQLTRGHLDVHRLISDAIGFYVEDEVEFGRFTVDMYVRELHVAVEFDGKDFHSSTKQVRRDMLRDTELMEMYGLPIERVTDIDLKKENRGKLLLRITDFFESFNDDIEQRRALATAQGVV